MDVKDVVAARRSIRKFLPRPVEEEKLRAVLEAGQLAPSANNRQEWKFIAVTDPALRRGMAEACGGQRFVGEAPAVLVACALRRHTMTCGQPAETVDVSIALSFMMLEAWEQGLGTCWLGFFYEEKVKELLGIPEDVTVVAVTPLGYPAENPGPRARKAFDTVVCREKYC